MNIAESMRFVLKNKSQDVLKGVWKDDLVTLGKEAFQDFNEIRAKIPRGSKKWILTLKITARVLKNAPQNTNRAFAIFKEDLLHELEKLPDNKEKTKFSLRVLGALVKTVLTELRTQKSSPQQVLLTRFLFRLSTKVIIRFLDEVKLNIEVSQERDQVEKFRNMLADQADIGPDGLIFEFMDNNDPAQRLVRDFKNHLFSSMPDTSRKADLPQ